VGFSEKRVFGKRKEKRWRNEKRVAGEIGSEQRAWFFDDRRPDPRTVFLLIAAIANRWDLPKGHCERGGNLTWKRSREMQEETGISPEDCRFENSFFGFDLLTK